MSQDVQRAQQRLRRAEALVRFVEAGLDSGSTNQNELRIAQAKYQAARLDLFDAEKAAAGTPPENAAPASNPTPEPPPINDRVEQPESPAGVSADTSPAANQADAPSRRNRRQRAQAQRSAAQDPEVQQQAEESIDEFSDIQRDISVEPEVPTQDPPVNQRSNNRARAQAQRIENADAEDLDPLTSPAAAKVESNRERTQNQRIENAAPGELSATSPAAAQVDSTVSRRAQAQIIRHDRIVTSDPTSYESLTDEQLRTQTASTQSALNSLLALPTQERLKVQAQIDALENQLDLLDKETARRATRGRLEDQVASGKRAPKPVDDQEAQDLDLVPEEEDPFVGDEIEVPDPAPQLNNAALERLKQQAAIKQDREPESPGDWRVKLRLASGASYLYKFAEQTGNQQASGSSTGAGILSPLISTDGVVFPYTPRISTLYQAEYNNFHPTHSNYQYYWYKGSKVGEVQLDATFTAQDTKEAEYLLACIHFFKSASKMFYGQDANRGSPPPLLFLTGLGDYQFNEHPCVISQFNYILPNDVDYVRAYSTQIDQNTSTLQYNLRNKNINNGPSWAGTTTRRLINGLSFGAENKLPSLPANLNSDDATYVPTQIEINLVLLPIVTRLSASQQFSLREYANGNALKAGFW